MDRNDDNPSEGAGLRELRRFRFVSWMEGGSLVLLVCVAVPLKHLGGITLATAIMGPLHGAAFLVYMWMLMRLLGAGIWTGRDMPRLVLSACIPFGAFANAGFLRRRIRQLSNGGMAHAL